MELAEQAARLKVPVFPCRADKTPACPHGFKDAATGEDARVLFKQWPGDLIGMPTGAASGYDALDIDSTRHIEAKAWLATALLPETRMHQTKSGGFHFLFQHKNGLRNWTSRPVPGVDGRGDGGYIILWPLAGFATNNKPVAAWPVALLAVVAAPKPKLIETASIAVPSDIQFDGIIRAVGNAINGARNDLLFWGSCRIGELINAGHLTRSVGETVLTAAAQKSGLDAVEIARTIASGFRSASDGTSAQ